MLHQARGVVGVVDVLVPQILDVGIVSAVVQKPIGSNVPNDHQVHVVALLDQRRNGLSHRHVCGSHRRILQRYEIHLGPPVDHRFRRISIAFDVHVDLADNDALQQLLLVVTATPPMLAAAPKIMFWVPAAVAAAVVAVVCPVAAEMIAVSMPGRWHMLLARISPEAPPSPKEAREA